ncbi:MAG TPA: NAD(P)/FAD-dependent oxidoreductase, partial [Conexibacter sp.]
VEGRQTREQALAKYHGFSARHAFPFDSMLRVQRLIPRIWPRTLAVGLRAMTAQRFVDWSFGHYLRIAHPSFALEGPHGGRFANVGGAEAQPLALTA